LPLEMRWKCVVHLFSCAVKHEDLATFRLVL
jgi:hypothetical protein